MDEKDLLAEQFEAQRTHLGAVAYRMLGSVHEADDAVQETWLRLHRSDTSDVANLGGWLTTVVSRVCLDMLRSRTSRREDLVAPGLIEPELTRPGSSGTDPEQETVLADSIGPALIVVLETLAPAERLAFVLHDMFAVPYDEIAPIVGRSTEATRQLASRARRRVQGTEDRPSGDRTRQREIVTAFLAASRGGRFDRLLALLDPDVVLRADAATVRAGAEPEVLGAPAVAATFSGRAKAAQLALVDGAPGLVWARGGEPRVVFTFQFADGRIAGIGMLADPVTIGDLDLEILAD